MTHGNVLLVNSNEMRPPVAPLALDYIGDGLRAAGFHVRLLDLAFASRKPEVVAAAAADADPLVVGVTFRNTDDCYLPSGAYFVPRLRELVSTIRSGTAAPIVLGGCGYSIFPEQVLDAAGAELGIAGDGEEAFLQLATALANGTDWHTVPGLVFRSGQAKYTVNPPQYRNTLDIPSSRGTIDNARYFREGGQGNVETKRGCPHRCTYCADPVAKGRSVRCRPPGQVADEIDTLLGKGVNCLHLCDGEFNIPIDHAIAVCEALTSRRLGERARWYCYCTVSPFTAELAAAMREAGCVGINFGVDSGCDRMLSALRRGYTRESIRDAVNYCRRLNLAVMLDLLIGGPGETVATTRESIEFIKAVGPDRVGATTGVRVYPGTDLADLIRSQGPLTRNPHLHGQVEDNDSFLGPLFYVDRGMGERPLDLVVDLIGGDQRFFPPPRIQDASNYNYNDNSVLENAIQAGHRGAYWDILRRL
ncbi:MAG: radical SAM protein [Phycisphaerae bacterium]|nr:radical SAM protein [Phycisphaerae bacterium]